MATRYKLQSAVEYLTTYSWAILLIGIVIAGIFYLGLTSQSNSIQQCQFPAVFQCISYSLASNGLLTVGIVQNTPDTIYITAIGCSANSTVSNMIPVNKVSISTNKNLTASLQCHYSNGAVFSANPGTLFAGTLQINYTDAQNGLAAVQYGKLSVKAT